jgi:hypothetical protein
MREVRRGWAAETGAHGFVKNVLKSGYIICPAGEAQFRGLFQPPVAARLQPVGGHGQ